MSALEALAGESRWVAWRYESRGGRATKVPHAPNGKRAKADDPATWGTRSEAERCAAKLVNGQGGGIGIELGDLGGDLYLAGVDLDSCIDAKECLAPWAERILLELPTYCERSPSRTGVKALFYCAREHVRAFLELIGVTDPEQWGIKRSVGADGRNHGPGVEIYFAGRYFAVTEDLFLGKDDHIATLDWEQLKALARLVPSFRTADNVTNRGADNSRSVKAFRKGAELRRVGRTFEEMVDTLRNDPETADWVREKGTAVNMRELRRIWEKAAPAASIDNDGVSLDDFYAYMPQHKYIFTPTRELWPAESVNSRFPPVPMLDNAGNPVLGPDGKPMKKKASAWLDQNAAVEQMTWCPGLPMIVADKLVSDGGWIDRKGVRTFNLYRPPILHLGDPAAVHPWLAHVRRVFPDDADHIIRWLAHRVQRPQEKINHALKLGGDQGIGKDTILEPVKRAVGAWNFSEPSPQQVMGRFNGFLKAVIMRINEARDLGEYDRFKFYDHMKAYTAAPPDVLRCDEKNIREHAVFNVCGVIITSNHKVDGIYLPADDRRHYVAWSDLKKESFSDGYWNELYGWYAAGGADNVSAYLRELDLSGFDPKAPPPKTPAFWEIVNASRPPEDAELADVLDELGNPKAVTLLQLSERASGNFADYLQDRRNSRVIPHRLEECGYVRVRNDNAIDGQWKVDGKRQAIYGRANLPLRERYAAAAALAARR